MKKELGTWSAAVSEYHRVLRKFKTDFDDRCLAYMAGEISEDDLEDCFVEILSHYPLSEVLAVEKGFELTDKAYVFYEKTERGVNPYPHSIGDSGRRKPKPTTCAKKKADEIVRRIVSHYHIQPHLPHVVFIGNGGPGDLSFGHEVVKRIEGTIAQVLREGQVPEEGPISVPRKWLFQILEDAEEGDHE